MKVFLIKNIHLNLFSRQVHKIYLGVQTDTQILQLKSSVLLGLNDQLY